MPTISRLFAAAMLGALLLLTGCKDMHGVAPSPQAQEDENHNTGKLGGGY